MNDDNQSSNIEWRNPVKTKPEEIIEEWEKIIREWEEAVNAAINAVSQQANRI